MEASAEASAVPIVVPIAVLTEVLVETVPPNVALPAPILHAAVNTLPARTIDETETAMIAEIVTETSMTAAAPAVLPTAIETVK